MQILSWNNKLLIDDLDISQRRELKRSSVGGDFSKPTVALPDTVVNRLLLDMNPQPLLKYTNVVDPESATRINVKARDYQVKDIMYMLQHKYILNRNKPGYGKTFESIEYCRLLNLKRILVVCPKSVCLQWRCQFEEWWPEVAPYVKVWGAGPLSGERSIFVTNYEQLTPVNISKDKRKKELIPTQVWQQCKQWSWDIIIVDESHRIKNPHAQITGALEGLPSQRRMLLTGTPILKHPDDLWSQLHFLHSRVCGDNYWDFTNRFCEVEEDDFGRKPLGLTPSENAKKLLQKVLSLISVGGQNQNVTLGTNLIEVPIQMTPEQRKLYYDVVRLSLDELEKVGVTVKNAMDQIIKQQQITTNVEKFLKGKTRNPKFDWVADWLEDNEDEKIVVFSKFAETVKALVENLQKRKIKCATYIGEMKGDEREHAKQMFIANHDVRVIAGTIGAMGTGVDGLQKVCNNVVFMDLDWSPGLNEQAWKRVERSGQQGVTNVWILHADKTIDRYVDKVQGKKADDIREVFENVRSGLGSGE